MGKKPSLTQFCPLRRGPNGLVESCLTINSFLHVQGISRTVILSLITILLHHGEVPCDAIMVFYRSSNFVNFPSAKFPREPSVTFQSYLSSYIVSILLSSEIHLVIPFPILILIFFWHSNFVLLRFSPRNEG
jgi:hypothetical protein